MLEHLGAFFGVSAVVIITPGPDTALTIRNTLFGGRRAGIFTAVGVSSGQATWALAAAAGIATLLKAAEPVYVGIRLAGAAYLIFLGVQAVLPGIARVPEPVAVPAVAGPPRLPTPVALRQGLISNITHPKMAIFFTSLLPQFVSRRDSPFLGLLALGLVFSTMTLLWLTAYAFTVAKTGDVLRRPAVRRTVELITGTALVGLAARIIRDVA
jgi:threonine/homoserine/homoserine lactone efflux protein